VAAGTRDRIVESSAELFRRQGYNGTGVKQIVAEAGAPFGSLYHFFPGGKEQLGAEVIRTSGALYLQLLGEVAGPAPDVATGIEWFFAGAADTLVESGYADACPIATVALEVSSISEPLREAAADVFESWVAAAVAYFAAAGIESTRARRLAYAVLSLLEGAFVFSRAQRDTEPMHAAGACAAAAVRAALGEAEAESRARAEAG
jgi:AcrR family transcriptional regulator